MNRMPRTRRASSLPASILTRNEQYDDKRTGATAPAEAQGGTKAAPHPAAVMHRLWGGAPEARADPHRAHARWARRAGPNGQEVWSRRVSVRQALVLGASAAQGQARTRVWGDADAGGSRRT